MFSPEHREWEQEKKKKRKKEKKKEKKKKKRGLLEGRKCSFFLQVSPPPPRLKYARRFLRSQISNICINMNCILQTPAIGSLLLSS